MDPEQSRRPLKVLSEIARCVAIHLCEGPVNNDADRILAREMAREIEDAVGCLQERSLDRRRSVRGLRFAPYIFTQPSTNGFHALHNAAMDAFSCVNWSEFYEEDDWSRPFLSAFANGEGIGPDGLLRNDHVILGLFLQGPNTTYPLHAHPAAEFYIAVAGQAEFQVGEDRPFVLKQPGGISLHREEEMHSIRTGDQPFFAAFGWFGKINEPSWYLSDVSGDVEARRYPTIAKG